MLNRHPSMLWIVALVACVVMLSEQTHSIIAQQRLCPDAPPAFLAVGASFGVQEVPSGRTMVSRVLRTQPGQSSPIAHDIDPRTWEYKVLDGPVCKDGYTWWKVKATDSDVTGWIAEGDADGYYAYSYSEQPTAVGPTRRPTPTLSPRRAVPSPSNRFAAFNPGQVGAAGKLQPYTVMPDLSNVVVSEVLSQEQVDYLRRNAFVISPGSELEFYSLYEQIRYNYQPLFITTDSMLHSFHLVFDKVLRTAEELYFYPTLRDLNQSLLIEVDKTYRALKGTDWEESARRTVAYVALAARLSAATSTVLDYAKDLVDADMKNIDSAAKGSSGFAPSAIFPGRPNGEDWSQYIPRGHYTKSDQLSAYFRAMLWYGRMTFRLDSPDETRSALLLAVALRDTNVAGRRGIDAWADLYDPTVFFVGVSDSLTIPQYLQTIDQVYGDNASATAIRAKGVEPFLAAASGLNPPTGPSDTGSIDAQAKGLRFMGQRFTMDGAVLRQLVYQNVGTAARPRSLPSALDVFAAMGSDRAAQILDTQGQTNYENYRAQMDKVRADLRKLSEADWAGTLYGAWLYTLNTLGQPAAAGYPSFMTNPAYLDRNLFAALGSYAQLKHDTVMYASQSYAEGAGPGGKGVPPEPVAPPNYVEPLPLFWARLAALAEMTAEGLRQRHLLDPIDQNTLKRIADLSRRFQAYSIKELNGQLLTDEEQEGLRNYGEDLKRIQQATADNPEPIPPWRSGGYFGDVEPPQIAVVADIATGVDTVLQIGVGRAFNIYAVVPVGDKLYLAQGGVFGYYEFEQPLANRLTDDAWRKMLREGKAPPLPDWSSSFLSTRTINEGLVVSVREFQGQLIGTLWWDPVADYQKLSASKTPLDRFYAAQLKPLADKKQYVGRQVIEVDYRSFDLKDAETAIVTTRETWRDELYSYGPTAYDAGQKVAERGPYVMGITYTLQKIKAKETYEVDRWEVVNVVLNSQPPDWKPIR